VPDHQQCCVLLFLAQQRGVAGVHIRRERFAVQRVAVVPECDQAEPRGGGVDHRAVADDGQRRVAEAPQERPIAVGVALPGVQPHDRLVGQHGAQGRLELILVAVVGHRQDRRTAGSDRGCRGSRHRDGPGPHPAPVG
jgi:hypothetical protein